MNASTALIITEPHNMGYGIGLAIVKSIMQAYGGEITVENALGEGSKFTVTLPKEM